MSKTLPRVVAISGSLRAASFSTAILTSLAAALSADAAVEVITLGDVPLYNQDIDTDTPPQGVAALREAVKAADLVVIASGEYNYGIPGVLKNALDWASRPYGQSAFNGKKTVFLTESPAFTGGVRSQAPLREVLIAMGATVVGGPEIVLGSIHEKIVDGVLNAETLAFPLGIIKGALAK
jgi:chromate reductase